MKNGRQEITRGVRPSAMFTDGWRSGIGLLCLALVAAIMSPAQDKQSSNMVIFKTLYDSDTNGGVPATLVQGTDGNLYGTSPYGGANGFGNVLKVTPSGSVTVLYDFCAQTNCADGGFPGSLVLGTDGNLYGTTEYRGVQLPIRNVTRGLWNCLQNQPGRHADHHLQFLRADRLH